MDSSSEDEHCAPPTTPPEYADRTWECSASIWMDENNGGQCSVNDDGRAQGVSWDVGYPGDWEQSHSPPGSPGSNRIEAAVLLSAGKRRVRRIVVSDSSDEGYRGVQRPRIDAPQDEQNGTWCTGS